MNTLKRFQLELSLGQFYSVNNIIGFLSFATKS